MKLTLKKNAEYDWYTYDWYTIERAEHEDQWWTERVAPNVSMFMYSGRISDACVEGPAEEMIQIALAIKARGCASFRRCAVDATADPVRFWSPRNSDRDGEVPLKDADDLADEILATLAPSVMDPRP